MKSLPNSKGLLQITAIVLLPMVVLWLIMRKAFPFYFGLEVVDLSFLTFFILHLGILIALFLALYMGVAKGSAGIGILMLIMFLRMGFTVGFCLYYNRVWSPPNLLFLLPVFIYYLTGLVSENIVINHLFRRFEGRN